MAVKEEGRLTAQLIQARNTVCWVVQHEYQATNDAAWANVGLATPSWIRLRAISTSASASGIGLMPSFSSCKPAHVTSRIAKQAFCNDAR